MERLVKYLAAAGAASRRNAGELVKAGRVAVDGTTVTEPGFRVPDGAAVTLDGRRLQRTAKYYILLHKPRGYVCTHADPHAPRKAADLVKLDPQVRLAYAGRLDKESEGMLILSNDGDYIEQLTHPSHQILKRYHVTLERELIPAEMELLRRGIVDDGEALHVEAIERISPKRYQVTLNEGKKREIRRLTAHVGAPTVRLIRVRTGALLLGDLAPGCWRELSPEEVALTLRQG